MDELLFIVEGVAIVNVELALCSSLSDKKVKTSSMTMPLCTQTCQKGQQMTVMSLAVLRVCTFELPEG